MQRFREFARRLGLLPRRAQFDRDLEEEMRLHRELKEEELLATGLSGEEARYAAQRQFGNITGLQQESREMWRWNSLEHLLQDVRHGLRVLRKNPGFTAVAVLTLSLGIGANTAIFSVVNGVLLRPLPYPEPQRLVTMTSNQSWPDLEDIRTQSRSYDAVGGVVMQALDFTGEAEPLQVQAGLCNADLFQALGARPALGRLITPEEDRYGGPHIVVLSHGFWSRHFGAEASAIGKSIVLSGNSYTVIGVLPPDFWTPGRPVDVWVPLRVANPNAAQFRGVHFLDTYLRLKAGVTMAQAQSEMGSIDEWLARQYPEDNQGRHRRLAALLEKVVGDSRAELLVLFGAVGFVLLIACVNFASLLLARGAVRQREMVIRAALGAGAQRLMAQVLTESVLLSLLGGAGGLLLARGGLAVLLALKPANLPRLAEVSMDARVLAFTIGVSVFTGILFGLLPAFSASRLNLNDGLKETGRSVTGGASGLRVRRLLVVCETALALILLVGAGLLIRSFWLLQGVAPGFHTDRILTMRVELPEARYPELAQQRQFRAQLLEGLNALPAVQAAMVSELPLSGDDLTHNFAIEGRPPITPGEEPELETRTVGGDYFRIMDIPLLRGRDLAPQDRDGATPVVVVNQSFAREYFSNADPIGARIRWARETPPKWMTIVGVVGDVKHFGLSQPEEPAAYDSYAQTWQPWKRWMSLVVRSPRDPAELIHQVKNQISTLDAGLPVTKVATMHEVMASSVEPQKFNLSLLSAFAGVALLLAAIGIYGVMAYSVTQRAHEIGIRMALGAQRRDIVRLVLGDGVRLAAFGAVLGLAGAMALTRVMSSLLFGVSAHDPATFVVVSAILGAVAALACYLPARRAMRADPMTALHYE